MKKFIFLIAILIIIPILSPAQNFWKDPADLYSDYGIEYSDADSAFYYSGFFYIVGADTIDLHIPVLRTIGMIKAWGYITALDSMQYTAYADTGASVNKADTADVVFSLAVDHGNGRTKSSHFTHTFTAVDTAAADSLAEATFDIYFPEWDTLMDQPSNYYIIRMRGIAGCMAKIWIRVEWISAF